MQTNRPKAPGLEAAKTGSDHAFTSSNVARHEAAVVSELSGLLLPLPLRFEERREIPMQNPTVDDRNPA